jgi:hypothetical protein
MPTAEELYGTLIDLADELDGTTDEKVTCPNCGQFAHPKWWPSGYYDDRERLNPALWSHARSCGDPQPQPAKKQKTAPSSSGGSGGGNGGGNGGGGNKRARMWGVLGEMQDKLDEFRELLK